MGLSGGIKTELYIYTPDIELVGVIDSYSSLRWRRKFFEPGEIELHVAATDDNLAMLAEGNFIHRTDRDEFGVIEGIVIGEAAEGEGDEITVTGRMGSCLLEQRVIVPTINFTGTNEAAMRKVVSVNANTDRPIPHLRLGALKGFSAACAFQATGKNVLTVLVVLAKSGNIGFRFRLDVPNQTIWFETVQGTDKTVTQTERPYVLFSEEFGNITGPQYTLNSTGFANFAYVAGEGEGDTRTIVMVDQTDGGPRREIWVDARDLQKGDLTDTDYQAQLVQRGLEKLSDSMKTESFEASAVDTENFLYLIDWNLGDIVSFQKWGILLNQRITEVEEVDENGTITITPTCGTPLPETLDLGSDT